MSPAFEAVCERRIAELKKQIKEFSGDKQTLGYVGLKSELRATQDFLKDMRKEYGYYEQ